MTRRLPIATGTVLRGTHRALSGLQRRARRFVLRSQPGSSIYRADLFLDPIRPAVPSIPPGPTIVLLNDCRDQVNYGAQALIDGLLAILSASAPDATIIPIPSHWLIDLEHGLGAFANNGEGLKQPTALFPTVADQFESVADAWMEGRGGPGAQSFLARLDGADLVVLNGEGSMYRTNLSAIRELFLAWLSKERLGIPTVFVNGTVHLTDVVPVLPSDGAKDVRVS